MTVLIAFTAGAVLGALGWRALRPALERDVFLRENYRGHRLPTAGGIVLVAAVLAYEVGYRLWLQLTTDWSNGQEVAGLLTADPGTHHLVLATALGFALLGLFDDLGGDGDRRGFRGHLSALARGRMTTGGLKLLGGSTVAFLVVAPGFGHSLVASLRDAAVIALGGNVGNLFDRAPGRTVKVALLATVVVVAAGHASTSLASVAVVAGAALALLWPDLREQLMLGDTGANVLGAVLGLGAVVVASPAERWVVLGVLVLLNGAAEVVSFSKVIDSVPPLRWFDRLGRLRVPDGPE